MQRQTSSSNSTPSVNHGSNINNHGLHHQNVDSLNASSHSSLSSSVGWIGHSISIGSSHSDASRQEDPRSTSVESMLLTGNERGNVGRQSLPTPRTVAPNYDPQNGATRAQLSPPPGVLRRNIPRGFQNGFTGGVNISSATPVFPQRNTVEEYEARVEHSVVRFDSFGSGGQNSNPVSPSSASVPLRDVLQSRPRILMMRAEGPDLMPFIVPVLQPSVSGESRARLLRRELLALEDETEDASTGLSEEAISKGMRRLTYQSMRLGLPVEERCCICQEDYVDGEEQGKLDCGHDFHFNCIGQWLMQKNSCPLCKAIALPT